MHIIHLIIIILLIVLVYFFFKPRILEGYGGGGHGHGHGGGRGWYGHGGGRGWYGHGGGRGWYGGGGSYYNYPWYYPAFLYNYYSYPCKNGCTNENGVWGCPFAGNGINDCVFASDCYGC